jgi:serine/threonine-protein kinase
VCKTAYLGGERVCPRDAGAIVPDEDDPWIGKTIDGRYVIRRLIGRGGMGLVYEAHHEALDRRVAVKFILKAAVDDQTRARFRREAKIASQVAHEHVVQVYDVGVDAAGNDYIAMEYVEGRDLAHLLLDGPLAIERASAIARQMLLGLHAIHQRGIIHRDVKPANVLLTSRDSDPDFVKLMDFGVARSVHDPGLTATGLVVGTTEFMSPEQLRGAPIDHRVDLYAVGVTLFAMFSGDLPFKGSTAAVAGMQVFERPPSLANKRPGLPPALIEAVERALAKSPSDRFPDALAFANALDGRTSSIPIAGATPPITASAATVVERRGAPRPASDATRRIGHTNPRRRRWAMLAAFAVITIACLYWISRSRGRTPRQSVTAIDPPPIDAAVASARQVATAPPVDAGLDATVLDAPNPSRVAVAKLPSTPAVRPPTPKLPAGRCRCIPVAGPDTIALCPAKGTSLCRCDDTRGRSLCVVPLVVTCAPKFIGYKDGDTFKPLYGDDPCGLKTAECPDPKVDKYRLPGTVDVACSGYVTPWKGESTDDPMLTTGHYECDVCAGANLASFAGRRGDPCSGFYWRTGQPLDGTLDYCE